MDPNQIETQFSLMAILMGIFNFLHLIQIYTIKDNIDTQCNFLAQVRCIIKNRQRKLVQYYVIRFI